MKSYFRTLWVSTLVFIFSSPAFAVKCYVCGEEGSSTIQCGKPPHGSHEGHQTCHELCKDCILNQMTSAIGDGPSEVHKMHDQGFPCFGDDAQCQKRFTMEAVKHLLAGTRELKAFEKQLEAPQACHAESPPATSTRALTPELLEEKAILELRDQITEAFNLTCPNTSHHQKDKDTGEPPLPGILAPISGCNAANCETCNTAFCYLCLEPDARGDSHAHAKAHSGDYWEYRDGHTGLQVIRGEGQDFLEVEEYTVKETITNPRTGKKETRDVLVRRPYTYTDRYHWEIVISKLDQLFPEGLPLGAEKQVLAVLEPFLKKNKMWPFPVGKAPELWIEAVHDYFTHEIQSVNDHPGLSEGERNKKIDLLKRNQIALLQNAFIFHHRIAEHEKSEPKKESARAHAELIQAALISLNAPVLTSLDIDRSRPQAPQNNHVTPILAQHEDVRVRNIYADLQANHPEFFALGGAAGHMYVIVDPGVPGHPEIPLVPPFVLSGNVPAKANGELYTHYEAAGAIDETARKWLDKRRLPHQGICHGKGDLMTKEQGEALGRALGRGRPGGFNRNVIADLEDTVVWLLSLDGNGRARYFDGYGGYVVGAYRDFGFRVRCVRVAAW